MCDAVATEQRTIRLLNFLGPAPHDVEQDLRVSLAREGHNRKRRERLAPHGVNVAQRICRGDLPEKIRVVDDRSEKVKRLHQREVISKTVYPRVVGCIKADNQIWVERLFR